MKPLWIGLALAAAAAAQDATPPEAWTGSIDVGYRWLTDLAGNDSTYRSIINLGEGPKLFGADLSFRDPTQRLFDKLTLSGMGWGGDPYNTARLEASKKRVYRFQMDYRNIAYFDAVPSFANPFTGPVINQHAYDTKRRMVDLSLDLRPATRVVPYVGYLRNSQRGSGVTDFVLDANEYPVADVLRNQTETYRGGVRILLSRFHVSLEQGSTVFKDDQRVYNTVRDTGDRNFLRPLPFLGRSLYLDELMQAYGMRGNAPYTQATISGQPFAWLDVQGQFVYRLGSLTSNYLQTNTGQAVDLSTLLFYTSQRDLAAGTASRPHTSAIVGAEVRPFRRLRIVENWTTDRLHTASSQSIGRTLDSSTRTIALADRLVDNYNQQSVDAIYEVTPYFTLRAGHRYVWGDTTVRAASYLDLPSEMAHLARHAGVAAATYRRGSRLAANFEFEGGRADDAYYRTSLRDYSKYRARARYQFFSSLSVTWNLTSLDNDNPQPGVDFHYRTRSNGITLEWLPAGGNRLSLMADYARSSIRSEILYIVPQNFSRDHFPYVQNAHEATLRLAVALPQIAGRTPRLTAGGTLYSGAGSRPTHFYRPLAGLVMPIARNVSWTGEWRWYGFDEPFFLNESFRAHQFTTGLRITR